MWMYRDQWQKEKNVTEQGRDEIKQSRIWVQSDGELYTLQEIYG